MFLKDEFSRLFGVAVMAAGVVVFSGSRMAAAAQPAPEAMPNAETALAAGNALRLQIATECRQGNVIFKVKNAGTSWPKTSTFAIYRLGAGNAKMITKRRMRLTEGQQASFRIDAKRNPTGQLGLSVQPGWYRRDAKFDATATCR